MRKILLDGNTGILIATLVFFVFLYPLTFPLPYSDDWLYVSLFTQLSNLDFSWFFAQHNDHRIPIQKALHLSILVLTKGDYRILIALNIALVALTAIAWIFLVRNMTDRTSKSEWIVAGLLLHLGFNTVIWSFNFQFISSLLFLALANLFWVKSIKQGVNSLDSKVFYALTLCAWSGGNGLITSTVVGIGLLVAIQIYQHLNKLPLKSIISIFVWFFSILFIWGTWESSAATSTSASSPALYLKFGYEMSKSWLGIYGANHHLFSAIIASSIFIIALFGSSFLVLKHLRANTKQGKWLLYLPLLLSCLQAIAIVLATSIARAGTQPWWPGLELHYGYLVTAIPLTAWAVITASSHNKLRSISLTILCFFTAYLYLFNSGWRLENAKTEHQKSVHAISDVMSPMSADDVAKKHIKLFYWVDGPEAEAIISKQITILRESESWVKPKSH